MLDNIKTKLTNCVEHPSTLKEGFFTHADKKVDNHWINLSGLHCQLLLNKEVIIKALRKKLIEEIKKKSINTIIFTTQHFSGTSDFRLSCIDSIVYNALREFNRKKKIKYCYLRKMATYGGLTLNPKPETEPGTRINVLLITALSSHEELIKETLDTVNRYSPQSKSVLSIIGIETVNTDGKIEPIPSSFEDAFHTCLIKFTSDQRPNAKKDHTIEPNIGYNSIDYLKDFFRDMRNILILAPIILLICVVGYPTIKGFFEIFLRQDKNLLIGVLGVILMVIFYFLQKRKLQI